MFLNKAFLFCLVISSAASLADSTSVDCGHLIKEARISGDPVFDEFWNLIISGLVAGEKVTLDNSFFHRNSGRMLEIKHKGLSRGGYLAGGAIWPQFPLPEINRALAERSDGRLRLELIDHAQAPDLGFPYLVDRNFRRNDQDVRYFRVVGYDGHLGISVSGNPGLVMNWQRLRN